MGALSSGEYGDPKTQADLLKRLSPIHKLDRVKAAMMVMHGANDTNVPLVEAQQVVDTLKQNGRPVDFVLFPDEGHGWRKIPNRVKSTLTMADFFRRHLSEEESQHRGSRDVLIDPATLRFEGCRRPKGDRRKFRPAGEGSSRLRLLSDEIERIPGDALRK